MFLRGQLEQRAKDIFARTSPTISKRISHAVLSGQLSGQRIWLRMRRTRHNLVSRPGLLLAQSSAELVDVMSGGREQLLAYTAHLCDDGVAPDLMLLASFKIGRAHV